MRRTCSTFGALVLAFLATSASCKRHRGQGHSYGPPTVATDLRDRALATSRAFGIVRSLVDEVGQRMSGTAGDARAVTWALATMKTLGLEEVHDERMAVPHWERGFARATLVSSNPGSATQVLAVTALGGSVGTPEDGLEAEVIEVSSLEALEEVPVDRIKGKIVFFDKPMARSKDGTGYGKAVDVRAKGAIAAAKKGAIAVLIRSIGTSSARFPHTGNMRYIEDIPRIPAAALAIPDAELLHRTIERVGTATVRLVLGCKEHPETTSANVIGQIRGSEKPDEIVLIGAHLDSWDLGVGAIDDGAGVGIVLETARLLLELPRRPRRTVRVVLFANEESGLRGALDYARVHAAELGRHVIALELDLGAGKAYGLQYLAGPHAGPAIRAIAAPLGKLGISTPLEREAHGADLYPLRAVGVPVVDLAQDATRYFDVHHTADDTLDKVSPKDLDQVVAATVAFTFGAADSMVDFGRIPEDKRK